MRQDVKPRPLPKKGEYLPGDLVLMRRSSIGSKLIGWGQKHKFAPQYAYWTHCGIMVDNEHLAEGLANGVVVSPLTKYADIPHVVISTTNSSEERFKVVRFALHSVGKEYGFWEDLGQALYLMTGTAWRVARNNQLICSAMAAEALCRTDAIFPEEPLWCLPAHLAQYYDGQYS